MVRYLVVFYPRWPVCNKQAILLQTGARWYGVNSAIVPSQFDFKMVGSRRELSLKSAFLVF